MLVIINKLTNNFKLVEYRDKHKFINRITEFETNVKKMRHLRNKMTQKSTIKTTTNVQYNLTFRNIAKLQNYARKEW